MPRPLSRNNIIAGSFVLASAILAIAMSVAVSGIQKRLVPTNPYVIRFTVSGGAAGLKAGSPVNLGGQPVGRVKSLEFDPPDVPASVMVHVLINRSIVLHSDAWAFLERPLLGSMSAINLSRVGGEVDPQTHVAAPVLQPGGLLDGVVAPPSFLAQAGYGPEQVRQLKMIMTQASDFVDRIDRLTAEFENKDYKTVRSAIEDVQSVTGDVRQKISGWTQRADSILTQADDATARFKGIEDQISGAVSDADQVIKDFRATLDANRPSLDRIVANIDAAAKSVNEESIPTFNSALKTARDGAASFSEGGQRFNALVEEQTPNLRTILGNLRLAADQVKLTMVEVRRNPWRLLYTPKTKELESELFYDAARTYAEAVSDLRAASEALEMTSKTDGLGGSAVGRETVEHITQRLNEAFARYQEAEKELLKQMEKK